MSHLDGVKSIKISGLGCVVLLFLPAVACVALGSFAHAWRFAWRAWFGG